MIPLSERINMPVVRKIT